METSVLEEGLYWWEGGASVLVYREAPVLEGVSVLMRREGACTAEEGGGLYWRTVTYS